LPEDRIEWLRQELLQAIARCSGGPAFISTKLCQAVCILQRLLDITIRNTYHNDNSLQHMRSKLCLRIGLILSWTHANTWRRLGRHRQTTCQVQI
jgi:hypothetical protein